MSINSFWLRVYETSILLRNLWETLGEAGSKPEHPPNWLKMFANTRTPDNTAKVTFKILLGHQLKSKEHIKTYRRNQLITDFRSEMSLHVFLFFDPHVSWEMEETKCSSASEESFPLAPLHSLLAPLHRRARYLGQGQRQSHGKKAGLQ